MQWEIVCSVSTSGINLLFQILGLFFILMFKLFCLEQFGTEEPEAYLEYG